MPDKHLSSQFDSELNSVSARVMEMGGLVESQIRQAVYALSQFSLEAVETVASMETRINAMEPEYEKLSDEQLRAKTQEFKDRVAKGESLDSILPEAFAVVREGSKRIMKMRHFDVQLLGGMALHFGKIAEMRTGEGRP